MYRYNEITKALNSDIPHKLIGDRRDLVILQRMQANVEVDNPILASGFMRLSQWNGKDVDSIIIKMHEIDDLIDTLIQFKKEVGI